jgi:hypothetical protein
MATDSLTQSLSREYPRHFAACRRIEAAPDAVFSYLDHHALLAKHMSGSSWMMGGGRMEIAADAGEGRKLGSHIRMRGSAFGIRLFLDEVVTQYEPPLTKLWETVGTLQLLIIGQYRMGFRIARRDSATLLEIFLDYELPRSIAGRLLGALLAPLYAGWCVNSMLRDAERHFNSERQNAVAATR